MVRVFQVMVAFCLSAISATAHDTAMNSDSLVSLCLECAKISDPKSRSDCYDKIFGFPTKKSKTVPTFKGMGKWEAMDIKEPLTDKITTTLSLDAKEYSFKDDLNYRMVVACKDSLIVTAFHWGLKTVADAKHFVLFRIDNGPIDSLECIRSENTRGSIVVIGAKQFLSRLVSATSLRVTVDVYNDAHPSLNFDVRGFQEAVNAHSVNCFQ